MKMKKQIPVEQNQEAEAPENKGRKIANTVINVVLVVAIVLAALCTYVSFVSTSGNGVPNILGTAFFSVQTDSMYPTLLPGDLVVAKTVKDPGALRKGDIITYWTVINGERVLNTHTIHEIYDGGGHCIFRTKGDDNTTVDPVTVHESEVVGQYVFRIPGLGKVFDYLQTSTGFLLIIVLPVFLFFLYHLIQFFRVLFEYQNVKNRIRYEEERGQIQDAAEEEEQKQKERAALEAELRERLRAELLADMAKEAQATEEAEKEETANG